MTITIESKFKKSNLWSINLLSAGRHLILIIFVDGAFEIMLHDCT